MGNSMKKLTILFLLFSSVVFGQTDTTIQVDPGHYPNDPLPKEVKKPNFFSKAWVPAGLAIISLDLMRDSTKYELQKLARSMVVDTFRTHVDDWILYAPIVMMYGADLAGVPSKNTPWNQTKFLFFSEVISTAIVWGLKYGLKIQRPNNGSYNAYPSGHTSQAFVHGQTFYNEFRESAPIFASTGYLFSIATGALRVLNNRHWVPDVLLGAGIGILVTNFVYHIEPFKDWNPFKNSSTKHRLDMQLMPSIRTDYIGGNLRIRL
jgi:hypothetical protein